MPTPPSPVRDLDSEPQRYVGYLIRRAQQRHVALWSTLVSGVAEHARLEPLVESVQIELTRNLTDEDRDGLVRILRLMLR